MTETASSLDNDSLTVYFTDGISPIKIQENQHVSVLMPMRFGDKRKMPDGTKIEYSCPVQDWPYEWTQQAFQEARIQRKLEKARKRPDIVINYPVEEELVAA